MTEGGSELTGRSPSKAPERANQEQNLSTTGPRFCGMQKSIQARVHLSAGAQRKIWKDTLSKAASLRIEWWEVVRREGISLFTLYVSTLFDFFFGPISTEYFCIFQKANTF